MQMNRTNELPRTSVSQYYNKRNARFGAIVRNVFPETPFFLDDIYTVYGYDLEQYTIGQANFEYL